MTLKNAAWLFGALLTVFLLFSTYNERRDRDASRERLYERGRPDMAPSALPAATPREVVTEQTGGETFAGPVLTEPSEPPAAPRREPPPAQAPTLKEAEQRGGRVVVTGDAKGIRVNERPASTPKPSPPPPDRE